MTIVLQQLVLGVLIGGLYGLAAAGLSLIFGVMKVLNVAHGELIMLGGYGLPVVRLASLVIAFVLIGGLHLLLNHWRWGRAIRATADDWEAALMTGIDVRRAYLIAFAIGTALAGAAGTLVSVGYSISPSIGLEWTLKALIVVVLAGLGSMLGTFAGGLILGVAEACSAMVFGGPYREVVGLVIFLVVLVARPQGLFAK